MRPWIPFTLAVAVIAALLVLPRMRSDAPLLQVRAETATVPVPAGPFTMGVDGGQLALWAKSFGWQSDWFADETPAHSVDLPAFAIDRTEVTNAAYATYVAANGRLAPAFWPHGEFPAGQDAFPVVGVSWADADAYCRWAGGRLPTEAEWEKAARGLDGRLWSWGNEWNQYLANTAETARQKGEGAVAVGSYAAGRSPYGALDMTGNVWEWTSDWYAPYGVADPSRERLFKVARGGSWRYARDLARTTVRLGLAPGDRYEDVGFRCVRSP